MTLCDDNGLIYYLSATECGAQHDKSMAEEYPIELPKGSILRQDLGFLGHHSEGVIVEEPIKKQKNKELTFSQKLYNRMLASQRVVIEHTNSGVKRLRMIKDKIRINTSDFRDNLMVIGCALHNLRTIVRSTLSCVYDVCACIKVLNLST